MVRQETAMVNEMQNFEVTSKNVQHKFIITRNNHCLVTKLSNSFIQLGECSQRVNKNNAMYLEGNLHATITSCLRCRNNFRNQEHDKSRPKAAVVHFRNRQVHCVRYFRECRHFSRHYYTKALKSAYLTKFPFLSTKVD